MKYTEIDFGELSAEEEMDKNPELVKSGYYDFKDALLGVVDGSDFLILGNKGSGKSILGEHLKSTEGPQPDGSHRFVSKFSMKAFPFKSFAKMIPGDESLETRFPIAWQWALLVQTILSFQDDSGKSSEFNTEYGRAVENLTRMGVLPSTSILDLAKMSGSKDFKVKISYFEISGGGAPGVVNDLFFSQIVENLKGVALHLQSVNKHFIVIDGLDEQLSDKNNQFSAIAALITEADDLNKLFRKNSIPLKIVILCRKDIFARLPGANKNKATGYTINLSWYEDQVNVPEKGITRLAQFRAERSGLKESFFKKYFQATYSGGKSPAEYLLENTRYTPRDFLRLLTELKKCKTEFGAITADDIDRAVKSYSVEYFWPEIEDELDGYFSRSEISELKKALVHFQKREFKLSEFLKFCMQECYTLSNAEKMFEIMYDCGAISNRNEVNGKFTSKMKDGNDFNDRQVISIHRGALKALLL